MRYGLLFPASLIFVALVARAACGSESPSAAPDEGGDQPPTDESATSIVVNIDETYSVDDFEAVGYKKITRFDPELLAGVTDAWFGFFNQRDIEIRVYPSHQLALDQGVEPAELAVGKDAAAWQKKNPVRFDAYAVVDNVVMLCELEIASCEALIAQLD